MASRVTTIPAKLNPKTRLPTENPRKRRVAGYARVSTDKDEQFSSYEAQVDYYTKYIKQNPEWEFVAVYTDEGISGTSTKKRDGFKSMISDALAGKIDLIVTKSVSRFARNTVDSLVTIRELKSHGVECFFEKENIYTLDNKGELLLTIMSSLAQEESRSISENVTWGKRKQFADGKVSFGYARFLGYDKGEKKGDPPVVNKDQAKVVRRIYSMFMNGQTPGSIAKALTADGIPTPGGQKNWQSSTVQSILSNEKYKGDSLLQKTFTTDFLTHASKRNEGEIPQYYVEGSHEAIISPTEWSLVQLEIERRKACGRAYRGASVLSAHLVCEDCGAFYGPKVWNSTDKYRKTIWQCNSKFQGQKRCTTPNLDEQIIKARFIELVNMLIADKDKIIASGRVVLGLLTDCTDLDAEIGPVSRELKIVSELLRKSLMESAQTAVDAVEFEEQSKTFENRYDELAERLRSLEEKRTARQAKADAIGGFLFEISEMDEYISKFDPRLWIILVDTVIVRRSGTLVFKLRNDMEFEIG